MSEFMPRKYKFCLHFKARLQLIFLSCLGQVIRMVAFDDRKKIVCKGWYDYNSDTLFITWLRPDIREEYNKQMEP